MLRGEVVGVRIVENGFRLARESLGYGTLGTLRISGTLRTLSILGTLRILGALRTLGDI